MKAKTTAQRVASHRAKVAREGGRQIAVHLNREASEALDELLPEHGTVTASVNHALIATRKKKPRR